MQSALMSLNVVLINALALDYCLKSKENKCLYIKDLKSATQNCIRETRQDEDKE